MTTNEIALTGCSSQPLASYLKSLGVLRIIAEQLDQNIACHWDQTTFVLHTTFDESAILKFFCDHYSPTPLTAPWNGGSGFYPGDNIIGLNAIKSTIDPRFDRYKKIVENISSWPEIPSNPQNIADIIQRLKKANVETNSAKTHERLNQLITDLQETSLALTEVETDPLVIPINNIAILAKSKSTVNQVLWRKLKVVTAKARTECSRLSRSGTKEQILAACRNRLPDYVLEWMDATFALNTDGKAFFSPILGTGANEGRLDFTNNFMQRVTDLLLIKDATKSRTDLLNNALFGNVVSGLENGKIGQYDPGRAGGYNQGMGVETKDFVINPWDYILALEGTIVLASSMSRRGSGFSQSHLSAPFSVQFSPLGFASSDFSESGRGEIWLPLWEKSTGIKEIKQLFGEGRSTVGRRNSKTGLDFSRAVSTLGVDRGISAFERYVFLQRRGQSYVALPAGRFNVKYKKSVELLTELDPVLRKLDNFGRGFENPPASFLSARRQIDDNLFACATEGSTYNFLKLMRSIGKMEQFISQRDHSKIPSMSSPLYGLSIEWVEACNNGCAELRIAAALASIGATGKVGPIRTYLSSVSASTPYKWEKNQNVKCWFGNSFPERLGQLLIRRQMDADRYGEDHFPLFSHLFVTTNDVMSFLYGETDDNLLEDLLWGFTLINWQQKNKAVASTICHSGGKSNLISRTWCLLKLLHTQYPKRTNIRREPRILTLIQANRIADACNVAIKRLKVSECYPFDVRYEENIDSRRLLASLLIPVSYTDFKYVESLVLKNH